MIVCKSAAEVEVMQRNSQQLVAAIHSVESLFSPNSTTLAIDDAISEQILKSEGIAIFKGYGARPSEGHPAFPYSTCTNINEEVTNTIPSGRRIRAGDLLKLQVGMLKDGYHTKIQHAYAIGDLSNRRRQLLHTTKAALWAGIAEAKIGNHIGDIAFSIQKAAESAGFNVVREFVGHGIGARLHEEPNVPNYGRSGDGPKLEGGMVLQILPLVTDGRSHVRVVDNGWTAVTADGCDACLMGHVVAIETGGPRVLTFSARDHALDETKGQAVCILQVGSALRVFSLDDLGVHSILSPEAGRTIICGSAHLIQKRSGGFLHSQIDEFEALLNKPDVHESELQRFLELNPNFLLGSDYQSLRSRVILPCEFGNDLIPDFFLEPIAGRYWDIAELKLPNSLLSVGRINRERFAHSVFEACAQVRTYANYFDDPRNRDLIQNRYGILAYKPRVCVIIGRRFELDDLVRRQVELDLPWVRIVTYQDLLEKARHRVIV